MPTRKSCSAHNSNTLRATASINGERLWASLMDLARLGATPKGGVRRITLTETDREGRGQFVRWAREAGLAVRWDAIGNIFARRAGSDSSADAVVMGSHLDSQPSGGKFDGAYGVMAGLEVMRTLNERGIVTRAPLEVASWTNEEGSRFVPVMMGSGVFAGVYRLEQALAAKDAEGLTAGQALTAIGYAGEARAHRVAAYFEAHIEQGPVLEDTRTTIGVVQGALGQRWFDVAFTGQDAHAGPTPMELRRDALIAASRLVLEVNRIANSFPDYARGTVGSLQVMPNSRNVVTGGAPMTPLCARWRTICRRARPRSPRSAGWRSSCARWSTSRPASSLRSWSTRCGTRHKSWASRIAISSAAQHTMRCTSRASRRRQ